MGQILFQCGIDCMPACLSLHASELHEVVIIQGIVKLVVIKPS